MFALMASLSLAFAAAGTKDADPLMRRVTIDPHSHMHNEVGELLEDGHKGSATDDNPCSYLGCNSHTCAWASGGVITRVMAKKACSNAVALGSSDGIKPADGTSAGTVLTAGVGGATKVATLKDCLNLVRSQTSTCSGHFQLHKDSYTCSCVPAGATCMESEDEKVCRYQVVEQ